MTEEHKIVLLRPDLILVLFTCCLEHPTPFRPSLQHGMERSAFVWISKDVIQYTWPLQTWKYVPDLQFSSFLQLSSFT